MARRSLFALGAATMLFLAGCTGLKNLNIPVPPQGSPGAQVPSGTTTSVPDLTGDALPTVPASPPGTVPLVPGDSGLTGVVTGPNGVVSGATVLVERLVGTAVGSRLLTTNATGTWGLNKILGGLYRIRAWMSPGLDLITPQILLLAAGATQTVNLTLMSYGGESANATVAPSPPQVGTPSSLVVNVLQEVVGADGVMRSSGLAGAQVFVLAAGNVVLGGTNPATTNSSGSVTLTLECSSIGPVGLSATIDGGSALTLKVADCGPTVSAPASTTTTVAGSVP